MKLSPFRIKHLILHLFAGLSAVDGVPIANLSTKSNDESSDSSSSDSSDDEGGVVASSTSESDSEDKIERPRVCWNEKLAIGADETVER